MSADRELLKWAAKAAGYWSDEFNCPDKLPRPMWDPLEDDGDALRLAVKLRINIQFSGSRYSVSARNVFDICCEFEGDDTIRRAIVREAAEIGKAKP